MHNAGLPKCANSCIQFDGDTTMTFVAKVNTPNIYQNMSVHCLLLLEKTVTHTFTCLFLLFVEFVIACRTSQAARRIERLRHLVYFRRAFHMTRLDGRLRGFSLWLPKLVIILAGFLRADFFGSLSRTLAIGVNGTALVSEDISEPSSR